MNSDARHSTHKDPLSRLLGDRDPLEVARELFVYAPIGAAAKLSKDLPGLIEEGRARYGMAKVVGTFAAQQSRRQFEERLKSATHGFWNPPTSSASPTADSTATETTATVVADVVMEEADVEAPPTSDVAGLPVPRYDTLSATQVLSHLAGLTVEQRSTVAEFERNTRNRRTILNRIEQLNASQS